MDDARALGETVRETMYARVSLALRELARDELAAQRQAVLAGADPRQALGYAKVRQLFTEGDGAAMHDEVRAAFLAVSAAILGVAKEQIHE